MTRIYRIWRKSDDMWMYDVTSEKSAKSHCSTGVYYYTIPPGGAA